MKNIEKFKIDRFYYPDGRELTMEERIPLGLSNDTWQSLEDRAYQAAYDISNDWAKEVPDWSDVQEGFRRGVKEGIEYIKSTLEDQIKFYNKHNDISAVNHRIEELENILSFINETLKDEK